MNNTGYGHALSEEKKPVPSHFFDSRSLPHFSTPYDPSYISLPSNMLSPLIGRSNELTAIHALLENPEIRLVTIIGPAGVGKTRIAAQIAYDHQSKAANHTVFISLVSLQDPTFLIFIIAQALGLSENVRQPLFDQVIAFLRNTHHLLVLDNFEHLLPAAPQLSEILAACPQLQLLVTSRARLHLLSEHVYPISPLLLPKLNPVPKISDLILYPSIDLFIKRAQAVNPHFRLSRGNARVIAHICVLLEGLPLALELAAAHLYALSPQSLLDRLGQPFELLIHGPIDLPERHQTLRSTIQWSYNLLTPIQQHLFRILSAFENGCSLRIAEAICSFILARGQLLDEITALAEKSLIILREAKDAEIRIYMLDLLRTYGLELLTDSGELEAVCREHAHYYLMRLEQDEGALHGPQQELYLRHLEAEYDNLRLALRRLLANSDADRERKEWALRLVCALEEFWFLRDSHREGRSFLERGLVNSDAIALPVLAKALCIACRFSLILGDLGHARDYSQQCLTLCEKAEYLPGMAHSYHFLAHIYLARWDLQGALKMFKKSLALFQETEDIDNTARCLRGFCQALLIHGDYQEAEILLMKALTIYMQSRSQRDIAICLCLLAHIYWETRQSLDTLLPSIEDALEYFRHINDFKGIAVMLYVLGIEAAYQDNLMQARLFFEDSLKYHKQAGLTWELSDALVYLSFILSTQQESQAAKALLQEYLEHALKLGNTGMTALALNALACVEASCKDFRCAAHLWGAAEAQQEAADLPPARRSMDLYKPLLEQAHATLGDTAFTSAWTKGRTLTLEEALQFTEQEKTSPLSSLASSPPGPLNVLTNREHDIFRLLAQGLTRVQIAKRFSITPLTVKAHIRSIYNKLNISTRSEAIHLAFKQKLI